MASKRPLPSDISGGGGDPLMSAEVHFGALFLSVFFNAFSDALFEPSDVILEALGFYFGSLWGAFSELLAI